MTVSEFLKTKRQTKDTLFSFVQEKDMLWTYRRIRTDGHGRTDRG